jgi:hypothetical protein
MMFFIRNWDDPLRSSIFNGEIVISIAYLYSPLMQLQSTALSIAIFTAIFSTPLPKLCAEASKSATQIYQDRVMSIERQKCNNPQKKQFKGLTYELCIVNGRATYGYGDGPPGDAGPSFYLKNGKLLMFTETGATAIYLFKNGELEAEIVYTGTPSGDRIKTTFTIVERQKILDRATTYTNSILKVFNRKL